MRILHIALKDLNQIFRDWKSFLFLLIMPVAFTLLIGMAFSGIGGDGPTHIGLGIVDKTHGDADTALLFDLLTESQVVAYTVLDGSDLVNAKQLVADDTYGGVLIIPEDFEIAYGDVNLGMQLIVDANTTVGISVQNEMQRITNRIRSITDGAMNGIALVSLVDSGLAEDVDRQAMLYSELQADMLDAWDEPPLKVLAAPLQAEEVVEQDEQYNSYIHASAGITVQFALAGLTSATGLLVAERRSRTLQRMLTTPVSKAQILGGHFLAIFAMIFAQLVILVLFGAIVLRVPYFNAPLATLVMMVMIALFTAAFGMLIGAFSKDEEQSVLFTIMPMMVLSGLGGAWMPLETTSQTFRTIGHLTPVAWAVDGLKNITERGLGLDSVLLPALVLAGFAVVCMVLAVRLFRTE